MEISHPLIAPAVSPSHRSAASLLDQYSAELVARDHKSLESARDILPSRTEVFIAALPNDKVDDVVAACKRLYQDGLTPVPHIVARNIASFEAFDRLLGRLRQEACVDRCLVLGGDRDQPAGEYHSSLQLLETGMFQRRGITAIRIGCYPEAHPKVATEHLDQALAAKLALIKREGMSATLVSQFCFDADPIVSFARRLRLEGISAPLRVGVAGPANRALLIKYAMICGVGNSVRVLKGRGDLARNALSGETPAAIIDSLEVARSREPTLGLAGIHFFTFGSLAKSAQWAESRRLSGSVSPAASMSAS